MNFTRGNWEIIEQELLGSFSVKIWLVLRDGIRPTLAKIIKGHLEMTEIKEENVEYEPTLSLPYDAWQALKHSMIDKKVREKNEVEAELGATKYHLEDLRKLLKLFPDKL